MLIPSQGREPETMKTNIEVSGRKCEYCESFDAYPLTNGKKLVATVCESCYECGIDKSIAIAEAMKPTHLI